MAAKRLAEPLPGGALPLPIDYKTYVFGASRPMSRPISDAAAGTGGSSMTIAGGSSSGPRTNRRPPPPLAAMLEAAETLAGDMNCLRGDFYDVKDRPYFGDYRLYPGSGLAPLPRTGSISNWAPSGSPRYPQQVAAPSSAVIGIETALEEFHAIDDREKEGRRPADQDDPARALDRAEDA